VINLLEATSKKGFWFKIPSSPKGFAETGTARPSFPALRDDPPILILYVGLSPQVRLRRIEGLEARTQSRRKRREAKKLF